MKRTAAITLVLATALVASGSPVFAGGQDAKTSLLRSGRHLGVSTMAVRDAAVRGAYASVRDPGAAVQEPDAYLRGIGGSGYDFQLDGR